MIRLATRSGRPIRALVLLAACLLAAATTSPAAPPPDWTATLQPLAGGGERLPEGRIVVDLPVDLDAAVLPWLVLEVDDLDVSAMVEVDGLSLGYTPPAPLVAGTHRIRLAQFAEDGSATERGSFTFQIAGASAAAVSVSNEVGFNAVWRAAQSDLPEGSTPDDPWLVTLSDRLNSEPAYGTTVTGALGAEVLAYSNDSLSSTGADYADFGQHLLTARGGPLALNAGLHGPGPESIVLQGLSRRGLSGDVKLLDGGVGATAFVMRVTPAAGLKDFVGMDEPTNRVSGTTVTVRPWPTTPGRLVLAATFLDGKGPEGLGTAVMGDPVAAKGQAWGFAAESSVIDDRIRFRGEYARSTYDFDVTDPGGGEEDGDAWGARVSWTALRPKEGAPAPYGLDLEGEYRHVGTFFKSIGNPGLSPDRNMVRGATRATWSWIALDASLERTEDNADDSPTVPRLRNSVGQGTLTFGPLADASLAPVIGPASLAVTVRSGSDRSIAIPEAYEGTGTDRDVRDVGLQLASSLERWGWMLGWANGREIDNTGASPEVRRNGAQASLTFRPFDWWDVGINGQWNSSSDLSTDVTRDNLVSTLSSTFTIIPGALTLTGSYQYSTEGASDDSTDAVTSQVEGELAFQMAVGEGWPTFRTSLKGQYRDRNDKLDDAMDEDFYQVFLGLTAAWPYSAGTGAQGVR